jgi:hypothetical protein
MKIKTRSGAIAKTLWVTVPKSNLKNKFHISQHSRQLKNRSPKLCLSSKCTMNTRLTIPLPMLAPMAVVSSQKSMAKSAD